MKKTVLIIFAALIVIASAFFTYMYFNMCNYQEKVEERKRSEMKDSCCLKNDSSETTISASFETEITCPNCKFKKMEVLPTEICQLRYTCTNCSTELTPKEGDCCVFCSYGTHKCPSKQ